MSNRYLEKIAEIYEIEPTKLDKKTGVQSVGLNRQELIKLKATEDKNYKLTGAAGYAALGGAGYAYGGHHVGRLARAVKGAKVLQQNGPKKFEDFAHSSKKWPKRGRNIGAAIGALVGLHEYGKHVHQKSMRDAGFSAYGHSLSQFNKNSPEK